MAHPLHKTELTPIAPYDFDLALAYMKTSPSAVLETVDVSSRTYRRAVTLAGKNVLLVLQSIGTVDEPRLILTVWGDNAPSTLELAERKMRGVFALDQDPTPCYEVLARDPVMNRLLGRFWGLRPLLIADPFEALLWAVIGQQITVAFARKLKVALASLCAGQLDVESVIYPLLPAPEAVADLDSSELSARHFSRQKTSYLLGLSQAVVSGQLRLEELENIPSEEAISLLTRFKGVGRWTAEYVLMRGLGHRDIIPAGDLGLRSAIGRAYGYGRTISESDVRSIAENWRGWRGWAAFFWWLHLQLGEEQF